MCLCQSKRNSERITREMKWNFVKSPRTDRKQKSFFIIWAFLLKTLGERGKGKGDISVSPFMHDWTGRRSARVERERESLSLSAGEPTIGKNLFSLSHFFTLFSSNCINGHAGRPPSSPRNSLVMEKLEISNALQSKRSCTSRPASFGSIIIIILNMKSHFPQVRRTTRMAQLPRRMGQCQEWMRFGTSERRMPTESRTHFSGRPWWYATATDTTL